MYSVFGIFCIILTIKLEFKNYEKRNKIKSCFPKRDINVVKTKLSLSMRKLLLTLFAISSLHVFSQSQLGINYQSVIRNSTGTIMVSTPVTVEFKLYSTTTLTNVLLYHESHSVTTNQFGMANLVIGQGTVVGGVVTFSNIPWPAGIAYEVYVNSNLIGSRQPFVSVPYAFAAGYAPPPAISFTNNVLSVGGNTATIPAGTTYTAGSGININTGVITSTANIIGAGSTSVTGTYPNLTISTPTTQVYTAGPGIDISTSGVISNTATAITPTITAGNNITINPTTPSNSYTVSAPTYSLTQTGNNIDLLQNGLSIGTATLPVATSYSAGTGISISGNVISNTLTPVTPTLSVSGNSISINPGNTQALPNYSLTQSGANIDLTQNGTSIATVTLTAATSTSLSAGSSNIILNQSGNAYTITPVTPTFTNSGPTTITGFYPNFTVNSVASPTYTAGPGISISSGTIINTSPGITPTITGTGNAFVGTSGNSYTVNVPTQTLTVTGNSVITSNLGGSATISPASLTYTSASNTLKLTDGLSSNTYTLNNYSAGTGIAISGSAPNFVITNTAVISSPTITGTGIASVTTVGNTYTVNVPVPTYTPANGVLAFGTNTIVVTPTLSLTGSTLTSGASTNSVNLASIPGLWTAPTATSVVTTNSTSLVGIGTNTPTYKLDVYGTASVPATIHGYNSGATASSTGVFGENPNNGIGVYGQSNTGAGVWGKSTSGAGIYGESTSGDGGKFILSSNTTTANAVNAQTNGTGVALYAKSYNAVPLAAKFEGSAEIFHTSTAANPHLNFTSPAGSYGRVKFSNIGQGTFFTTEAYNDGSGNNEAYSISHFNGTNTKQVFLINGQRMAYVNALNYPLATFHVMTSTATAQGGIASEGFAQAGQLNLVRNNNAGAGARSAVLLGDDLGKVNFAGYDGSTFSDGAKIYARATESVTSSNKGTELIFAAVPTGTNTNKDAFKINGSGNLEIISSLFIPTGAANGKVLTSDATGNVSWQNIANTSPWVQGAGKVYLSNSSDWVGIGTTTPNNPFQVVDFISFESLGSNTSLGYLAGKGTSPNNYYNTFTGYYAGQAVGTGTASGNSFYGYNAGANSANGNSNSFFGTSSGQSNTNGSNNSFIGYAAGISNTSGNNNTALGYNSGLNNTTGSSNTFIGNGADLYSSTQYTNATAIGYGSKVDANDALILGNSNTKVGIGVTQPSSPLHVANYTGSQIKIGNINQPTLEWYWDVDATSNLFLRNEGSGTTQTRLYFDYNSGHLGLGSGAPGYKLTVIGGASDDLATIYAVNNATSTTSASHGVHGLTFSTYSLSAGVFGNNNSVGPSVYGAKSGTQTGIAGRFDILNTSNTADAVMVTNNGAGAAIHAVSGPTVTGSTNAALWIEGGHFKSTQATAPTASTASTSISFSGATYSFSNASDVKGMLQAVMTTTSSTSIYAGSSIAIKVNFSKPYSTPPVVVVTPGQDMAGMSVYVNNITTTYFYINIKNGTISTITAPSLTMSFNYMVIE